MTIEEALKILKDEQSKVGKLHVRHSRLSHAIRELEQLQAGELAKAAPKAKAQKK